MPTTGIVVSLVEAEKRFRGVYSQKKKKNVFFHSIEEIERSSERTLEHCSYYLQFGEHVNMYVVEVRPPVKRDRGGL